ncbi:hypothetical protein EBU99_00910 [bacterium]|nr:hypothetical protein [bacterium]
MEYLQKSALMKNLLRVSLLTLGGLICYSQKVNAENQLELESARHVNRSVLTVGREVFSATDALGLLMVWNLTRGSGENAVPLETNWLKPLNKIDTSVNDLSGMTAGWSADMRLFFELALICIDVQKLNLFIPREQDVLATLAIVKAQQAMSLAKVDPALASEVMGVSDKTRRRWIESVLRARTFVRVRGSLERNKSLFNVGWYWHVAPKSGLRK